MIDSGFHVPGTASCLSGELDGDLDLANAFAWSPLAVRAGSEADEQTDSGILEGGLRGTGGEGAAGTFLADSAPFLATGAGRSLPPYGGRDRPAPVARKGAESARNVPAAPSPPVPRKPPSRIPESVCSSASEPARTASGLHANAFARSRSPSSSPDRQDAVPGTWKPESIKNLFHRNDKSRKQTLTKSNHSTLHLETTRSSHIPPGKA